MLDFDDHQLKEQILRIPPDGKVAFATACAQRLVPLYQRYCKRSKRGKPAALDNAMLRLWHYLQGKDIPVPERERLIRRLDNLMPADDDTDDVDGLADSALFAAGYAIECSIAGDSALAVLAAEMAFETMYSLFMNAAYPDCTGVTGEMINNTIASPPAQTELARQQRDLDEIAAACQQPDGLLALIPTLRARAIAEAITFE